MSKIIEMQGIMKHFQYVQAVDDGQFDLNKLSLKIQ